MRDSFLNFNSIERALSDSMDALISEDNEGTYETAMEQLTNAQAELKRALSFSMSRINGQQVLK